MTLNKRAAIYAGTFDPITRGHEDLVRRAACLFDHVILGIAESRSKRPFFSLDERVEIARELLARYPNVEVCGFDGLLMDFLHVKGAKVILRGLRAASDFEYEFQMAGMNRNLYPDVETINTCSSRQQWCARLPCSVAMSANLSIRQSVNGWQNEFPKNFNDLKEQ